METEKLIRNKIEQELPETIFFTDDFREFGTPDAVNTALHRISKKGEIKAVARGIYVKPKYSDLLNKELTPSIEKIAKAIAERDQVRIIPTGSFALYSLGLSTQVPLNIVYLTDGSARKINIGKRKITFKRTVPRNLSLKGELSVLVVLALKEIGREKLTEKEETQIIEVLKKENYENLKHDIRIAPQWIAEIMAKAIK